MLFLGNISGHDFVFHLQSWMDAAGQWREGILFPRWAEWANWGFGEPRFVFYPPLSWLGGAVIGSVVPWRIAPGLYVWLTLMIAGMSMWRLAREWLHGPYAILAAVLYAGNPYQLVNVYYRSAFGELLAAALLPLLVWSAIRVISGEWRRVAILALAFAGVWLSNAPAAVIATYSLGIVILIGCVWRRSLLPLISGASAMATGGGLAAFYLVPATREQKWVQIAQIVSLDLRPSANFIFTRANEPDFVAFNGKVSWVAAGLIATTAVAALATFGKRRKIAGPWWTLTTLAAVATVLMLPPSLWLWRELPKLWFIQFPWRWLDVVGLAFAFLLAQLLTNLQNRRASWSLAAVLFAAIGTAGAFMIRDANWDTSDVASVADAIHSGRGYEGTDEYAPVGCDRYQFPGNPDDTERPADVSPNPAPRIAKLDPDSDEIVPATGVRLHTQTWTSERRVVTAESSEAVTLALRLVYYPAWKIQVNGRDARFDLSGQTRQILVRLPAGNSRIEIRFRRTPDRALGGAISIISLLVVLGLGFWLKNKAI